MRALQYIHTFERIITWILVVLMASVVSLATAELAWILGKDVLSPPRFLLDIDELLGIFGQFLLVLIGVELLHSMKVYLIDRVVHLEAVLVVAIIAVARKIVVLEPRQLQGESLVGIAAITLALTVGYYLVRRTRHEHGTRNPAQGK